MFFERHKHPPFAQEHMRLIEPKAAEMAARAERIADREARGVVSSPDDVAWIVWYRQVHDMLLSWLTEEGEAA